MAVQHSYGKMVTDGLVLYLNAADANSYVSGSTTWRDLAGSNNGTLTNGPTYSSANFGSIVFDGTNDYMSLATPLIPSTSNWTYSTFFNLNVLITGSVLYGQYIANTGNGRILIRVSDSVANSSQFSLFLGSGATYSTSFLYTTVTASINTPYNLTIVRENQTFSMYVNGTYNTGSTFAFTASILQTTPIIGGRTNNSSNPTPVDTDFLNGKIYSTQIYNRALSASEILQNYNATKTRFGLT
jgi:hypothetical protein